VLRAWAVEDVRAVERTRLAQVPPDALMLRAAAAVAATCAGELRRTRGRVVGARVVLLVGSGNNGGDALHAGARLAARGARVDALLTSGRAHPGGLAALLAAGGRAVPVEDAAGGQALQAAADLVVDGIVGLGGSAGLRGPAAALAGVLLRRNGPPGRRPVVVAVDLPSGVDPSTGATPGPHVVADVTVSLGAATPGLLLPPASLAAGRLVAVDLGFEPLLGDPAVERLGDGALRRLWPAPGPRDDKYRRGVVGVVAGSGEYTGAAVLAVGGALRSGAGMVRHLGPAAAQDQVRAHWPEAVTGPGRVQAWVLGPGVDPGEGATQVQRIAEALGSGLPCVLDAGALALLERRPDLRDLLGAHHVLTPHAGEAARLLTALAGEGAPAVERAGVEAEPLRHARALAAATGAHVLLKGAVTLVVGPPGRGGRVQPIRSQADAPPQLATAGAGDVLAGMLGTLLAAGLHPLDAAAVAAAVHGRAARTASAGGPLLAGDVAATLPAAVAHLVAGCSPDPDLGD